MYVAQCKKTLIVTSNDNRSVFYMVYENFDEGLSFVSNFFSNVVQIILQCQPPHDKTNKMTVRPAKTQRACAQSDQSETSLSA